MSQPIDSWEDCLILSSIFCLHSWLYSTDNCWSTPMRLDGDTCCWVSPPVENSLSNLELLPVRTGPRQQRHPHCSGSICLKECLSCCHPAGHVQTRLRRHISMTCLLCQVEVIMSSRNLRSVAQHQSTRRISTHVQHAIALLGRETARLSSEYLQERLVGIGPFAPVISLQRSKLMMGTMWYDPQPHTFLFTACFESL